MFYTKNQSIFYNCLSQFEPKKKNDAKLTYSHPGKSLIIFWENVKIVFGR
jgi:hypothetical protein